MQVGGCLRTGNDYILLVSCLYKNTIYLHFQKVPIPRQPFHDFVNPFSDCVVPPVTRCVADILEPATANLDNYSLTDFQWEKIRTSNYYNKKPSGRVLDVTGISRTIRSKYRVRDPKVLHQFSGLVSLTGLSMFTVLIDCSVDFRCAVNSFHKKGRIQDSLHLVKQQDFKAFRKIIKYLKQKEHFTNK